MRKLLIILTLCCFACGEEKGKSQKATDMPEPRLSDISRICFESLGEEYSTQDRTLQDSTVLHLEIKGDLVTGTFNWIPAEKDSRKGTINATKRGEEIKGSYYVTQEGIKDTLHIEINLRDSNAVVSTTSNSGEEMRLEVEKIDCQD